MFYPFSENLNMLYFIIGFFFFLFKVFEINSNNIIRIFKIILPQRVVQLKQTTGVT